jgi:hypothetical protein
MREGIQKRTGKENRYKRCACGSIEENGEGFVIKQPTVEKSVDIGNMDSYMPTPIDV